MKVNCCEDKLTPLVGQAFLGKTINVLSNNRPQASGVFLLTKFIGGDGEKGYRYPVHLVTGQVYDKNEVEVVKLLPDAEVKC